MLVSPRLLTASAVVLAAVAAPAHAVEATGPGGAPTAYDDASMCFDYHLSGHVVGMVTATGVVRTSRVPQIPELGGSFGVQRVITPNTVVSDAKALLTTNGVDTVCVGGAGLPVVAGTVVFTFEAQTDTASVLAVYTCRYGGPTPACV